jgi:hypothetical protein
MALGRGLLPSFVTAPQAASQKLAFVSSAGNAIMKVDNTTNVAFNQKRNTVRITTKDRFTVGSVWIADMLHVPFGVSLLLAVMVVVALRVFAPTCSMLFTKEGSRHVSLASVFYNLWHVYIFYYACTEATRWDLPLHV